MHKSYSTEHCYFSYCRNVSERVVFKSQFGFKFLLKMINLGLECSFDLSYNCFDSCWWHLISGYFEKWIRICCSNFDEDLSGTILPLRYLSCCYVATKSYCFPVWYEFDAVDCERLEWTSKNWCWNFICSTPIITSSTKHVAILNFYSKLSQAANCYCSIQSASESRSANLQQPEQRNYVQRERQRWIDYEMRLEQVMNWADSLSYLNFYICLLIMFCLKLNYLFSIWIL